MAPRGRPTRLNPGTTPPPVTDPTTTTSVTSAQLQAMIDEGVTAVLAARATTRNGDDSHTSGTGVRRNERAVRECTYQDFMKCQPLFFRGTEGVVDLTQWFERMETVFRISNCIVENQVKFATCTLMGIALTWWNSHVRTVTNDVAYAMTWTDLKKKMTTKYCPRNEIKKIEAELWNLKVKGTDVVAYNQRFQELALLCDRMFPEETDKIERYVGGMPDLIYSSVVASKPKTMQEAIEMATELMDRRINTFAERQAENKRKFEDTPRNNQNQQPNKRQNTGRAYAARNGDKKPYEGTKPLCPKCNFNHYGPCIPTCNNCKKLGHLAKDCRSRPATANNNNNNRNNNNNNNRNNNNNNNRNNNNPRAQGANTNAIVCFECGAPGHFKKDCPQWKNKNQGNGNAVAKAYAVGVAGHNPDNNVVTGGGGRVRSGKIRFLGGGSVGRGGGVRVVRGGGRRVVGLLDRLMGLGWMWRGENTGWWLGKGDGGSDLDGHVFLAHITIKETGDKSKKKQLQECTDRQKFPEVFPEGLARVECSTRKIDLKVGVITNLRFENEDISKNASELDMGHYEFQNNQEHEGHLKIILELLKKEELYANFPSQDESVKIGHLRTPTKIRQFVLEASHSSSMKQKLCSAPILALLEGSEDFIVYCDASIKGLDAVLMQKEKANDSLLMLEAGKERGPPLRVRALVMTISLDFLRQFVDMLRIVHGKTKNIKNEDVGGYAD
ncbi:putative reverse transcriptase domain-containing protein [Tanacetum coccineum]